MIIIAREYLERVKRKSFIITTLLVPVFMVLLMFAPAAIMMMSSPENTVVAVIDDTHRVFPQLKNSDEVKFKMFGQSLDSLKNNSDLDAILVVGSGAIERPNQSITLYTHGTLGMLTDQYITNQLEHAQGAVGVQRDGLIGTLDGAGAHDQNGVKVGVILE